MRQPIWVIASLLAAIAAILAACAGGMPNAPIPGAGRIVLHNQTNPPGAPGDFNITMSYGAQVSYPNGLYMPNGFQVDSGFILAPGIYTISEDVPSGWQLTIDISDPSGGSLSNGNQATINLAAGEMVTVTFINAKTDVIPTSSSSPTPVANAGRIVLNNQTNPPGAPGDFNVTMSYGAQVSYPNGLYIPNGFQVDSGFILAPGIYTISEDVPSGWQLTIDISDPSGGSLSNGNQATINLAAGEMVTVTFINAKTDVIPTLTPGPTTTGSPGRIILKNQIASTGGAGTFQFAMSYGRQIGYPDGVRLDASYPQIDSGFLLSPGVYVINESVPAGWQLTIDISDPSGGSSSSGNQATINLAAGETVNVTFINAKTDVIPTSSPSPTPIVNFGRIICRVQANPNGLTDMFSFGPSYGNQIGYPNGFMLRDGQQIDSGFAVTPGTYNLVEVVPAGWQLTIDISDPSGGSSSSGNQATINLAAGETVNVTFINAKTDVIPTSSPSPTPIVNFGRIICRVQANPNGLTDMFSFGPSYGNQIGYPNGFMLRDGQQIDSGFAVTPGTYNLVEVVPAGWQLAIVISDPSGNSSSSGNQATINLAAGETVTVTFIDTKAG